MKYGRIATTTAAVVLSALGVFAPAASAQQTVGAWENRLSQTCLDHNFTDGLHMRGCNGGPWQQWVLKSYSDGTKRFMNQATKYCLDSSEQGVRAFGCNDLSYQRWRANDWGSFQYELVNQYTHHCLDYATAIRDVGCNGLSYQQWNGWFF
jgi:Ricin-type beta-trefoil lectin domain